jgi:O-antigen/teichoic acid export membrane protein
MKIYKISNLVIAHLAVAAASAITVPVLTHFYSIMEIGNFAFFSILSSFLLMVLSMGLDQSYVREFHDIKYDPDITLIVLLFYQLLILNIFFIFFYISVTEFQFHLFDGIETEKSIILIYFNVVFLFFQRFLLLRLRMLELFGRYALSLLLNKFSFLFFLLLFSSNQNNNFQKILILNLFSLFISSIPLISEIKIKKLNLNVLFEYRISHHLRYGLPLIIEGVAYWIVTNISIIFLKKFTNIENIGVYSVGVSISSLIGLFGSIFSLLYVPSLYKKESSKNLKVDELNLNNIIIVIIIFFGFSIISDFSEYIISYFPPTYAELRYMLPALLIQPSFYIFSEAAAVGIGISRNSHLAAISCLISACIALLSAYFIVPIFGLYGACLANILAMLTFLFCKIVFARLCWEKISVISVIFSAIIMITISLIYLSIHFRPELIYLKQTVILIQAIFLLFLLYKLKSCLFIKKI